VWSDRVNSRLLFRYFFEAAQPSGFIARRNGYPLKAWGMKLAKGERDEASGGRHRPKDRHWDGDRDGLGQSAAGGASVVCGTR
jgi:hypothetical protein